MKFHAFCLALVLSIVGCHNKEISKSLYFEDIQTKFSLEEFGKICRGELKWDNEGDKLMWLCQDKVRIGIIFHSYRDGFEASTMFVSDIARPASDLRSFMRDGMDYLNFKRKISSDKQ